MLSSFLCSLKTKMPERLISWKDKLRRRSKKSPGLLRKSKYARKLINSNYTCACIIVTVILVFYIFIGIPLGVAIGLNGQIIVNNNTTPQPTLEPTSFPTSAPTSEPTSFPTSAPTSEPTRQPAAEPTPSPTQQPTSNPTTQPTNEPTNQPTRPPTNEPTNQPTHPPTNEPTVEPTIQPVYNTCCHANGPTCSNLTESECLELDYLNQIVETSFPCGEENPCLVGACCRGDLTCTEQAFATCISVESGTYFPQSSCADLDCGETIENSCCAAECIDISCLEPPQNKATCAETYGGQSVPYIVVPGMVYS